MLRNTLVAAIAMGVWLRAHGFTRVRLLDGSMKRWREQGREVATGS